MDSRKLEIKLMEAIECKDRSQIKDAIDKILAKRKEYEEFIKEYPDYALRNSTLPPSLNAVVRNGKILSRPLHRAIEHGLDDIVGILLNSGADIESFVNDYYVYTPLMHAVKKANVTIVEILLEAKAEVNFRGYYSDNIPLILAANQENIKLVEILLKAGADVEGNRYCRHHITETPLMLAAKRGDINMVNILLAAKADVNHKVLGDNTALMYASDSGKLDVVKILLEAKADVNKKNKDDDTALMLATRRGYENIVEILLENKADVNKKNKAGNTALIHAARLGHENILKILLKYNANTSIKTGLLCGATALDIAAGEGNTNCFKILSDAQKVKSVYNKGFFHHLSSSKQHTKKSDSKVSNDKYNKLSS